LAAPPRKDTSQEMVIACKNDDTFSTFLKNLGGEDNP